MQVRLAKTAGFCMGVRRAMGKVLDLAARPGGRLVTYGPLIHNPQVIRLLEDRHVTVVESPDDLRAGDRVAIRAHGVPPQTREAIRCRGATICDATCPHVARAQGLVKKAASYGRDVIIVGDRGHAEVTGLLGFARGRGHVVERLEDVDALPALSSVAVVAQTTQSEELFEQVEKRVRERIGDCEVHNTICGSTADRQREVVELSAHVDVLVVVGGRHSANTVRLAQIAEETGRPVVHVESADELREEDLRLHRTAGVTAGASTPNWVIEEVISRLEGFHTARTVPWVRSVLDAVDFGIRSGFLVAVGAAGLALASSEMLGRPLHVLHAVIAFSYVFSMLNWNARVEVRAGEMGDRSRAEFFRRHDSLLTILAACLACVAVGASACLGPAALVLVVVSAAAGIAYTLPLLPRRIGGRWRRLKDIPGSKNIFFAGAVGVVTGLVPLLDRSIAAASPGPAGVWIAVLFSSALAFARSVVLDVKDIQSDVFAGRETIPVVLGMRRTKLLLGSVLLAAFAAVLSGALLGALAPVALWQLPTLGIVCGFLFLYHLRWIAFGFTFHVLLDTIFLIPAAAVVAGRVVG